MRIKLNENGRNSWFLYVVPLLFIAICTLLLIWHGLRVFLIHSLVMGEYAFVLYYTFYYIILPILPILLSIAVILANNPIFSLFFLITLFFSSVLLLFSLKIEFLAMIYLIIYIGAISILFLFVIMIFNLKQLQRKKNTFFF